MNTKLLAFVAAASLATAAHAGCDKIDYTEAREMGFAAVAKVYCASDVEHARLIETFRDIATGDHAAEREIIAALRTCEAQMELYQRVIKNVYKRRWPSCK